MKMTLSEINSRNAPDYTYTDAWDRPAVLTAAEIEWFNETVNAIREALDLDPKARIFAFDFEKLRGVRGAKNAAGLCVSLDPERRDWENTYILIDTFRIHEKYEETHGGTPSLDDVTLKETICHEIAHFDIWRHGKRHRELTARYLAKVSEFLWKCERLPLEIPGLLDEHLIDTEQSEQEMRLCELLNEAEYVYSGYLPDYPENEKYYAAIYAERHNGGRNSPKYPEEAELLAFIDRLRRMGIKPRFPRESA